MTYHRQTDMSMAAEDDFIVYWADVILHRSCCDLVPLTYQEKSVLLSLCRYLEWSTRWGDLDEIPNKFVWELEHKLMTSCMDDLIRSNLLLYGALTGQAVDLTESGMAALLGQSSPIVHAGVGFDKWLNTEDGKTLAITLQEIKVILESMQEATQPDYSEQLTSLISKVQLIGAILGVVGV